MFWGFQTLFCQQLICPSHVTIAQLMSVTVLSLQTRLCSLSVTSLSLHRTRTRVSVPLLSLQCAIVTWQTLCNDSNSSTQVCDGNSEIGHHVLFFCFQTDGWWPLASLIGMSNVNKRVSDIVNEDSLPCIIHHNPIKWYSTLLPGVKLKCCPATYVGTSTSTWWYVMTWKRFPHYWHFVKGIHRSLVTSSREEPVMWSSDLEAVQQAVELSVIWDATMLVWGHYYDKRGFHEFLKQNTDFYYTCYGSWSMGGCRLSSIMGPIVRVNTVHCREIACWPAAG